MNQAINLKKPPTAIVTDHLDIWTSAIRDKSSAGRGAGSKRELYGIKKLRELILDLAVRGLLVPQDPSDEPASELLKKICAEKTKLIKEGKIKKPKKVSSGGEGGQLYDIPAGWKWTCIAELAEVGPRNIVEDDVDVSFVPMSLVSTAHDGSHGQERKKWSEVKSGYTHFADGDIAVAKITPCFENSKAAVFRNLINGIGAGTTELHVARLHGNYINPFFILLYLKAPQFLLVGEKK